ncbi:MAG: hypothetical protein RH980_18245 [Roseovarius confluentis]|jgi:hypothetical protein
MAKLKYTVSSAFAHGGKIYTPKKPIELTNQEAKPLLERGKIEPARGAAGPEKDEGDGKSEKGSKTEGDAGKSEKASKTEGGAGKPPAK